MSPTSYFSFDYPSSFRVIHIGAHSDVGLNLGFGATGSTSSPFGGNTSGFGTNTSSGGGLFGSNTATAGTSTGFGGFGGTGMSKPAFVSQPATGGSFFGGGSNAFGSSNNQNTSAFGGASLGSALGSNAECQGTGSTPFQPVSEKEGTGNQTNHYQSITVMQPYKNFSFEVSHRSH
ncbi:MAG: hypothetical protein LQ338_006447 [Usnochroma carphineum]|nr:MAG: hypothetical protein LQ338_006447 [Usnochroma carphineum]